MRKKYNLCLFVALLTTLCLSMSACVQSDNQGKQNSETNNEQMEDDKIPTLDEILEEQSETDEVEEDLQEYQEENLYEEEYSEESSVEEIYEEEP